MKKIFWFLFSQRKQFFRYLLVGSSGFVLDIALLYLFKQFTSASASWGVVVSQSVVVVYNYTLNKYWSFGSYEPHGRQLLKYLLAVGLNYCLGVGAMYLFHDVLGYNYLLIRVLTVACLVPLNFALYKYWVYRAPTAVSLDT